MPVIIQCVKCQRKLRVLDRLLGKLVKCPGCQTKFVAQASGTPVIAPLGGKAAPARASAALPASSSKVSAPPPSSKVPPRLPLSKQPAPKPPPSSKVPPPSRPAVLPASGRVRALQAEPPPEEITVGEEDFIPASALPPPRTRPDLDGVETHAALAGKSARRPRQSSFFSVFVTLGGILLVTSVLGMLSAWWINSKVQSLGGRPQVNQPGKP